MSIYSRKFPKRKFRKEKQSLWPCSLALSLSPLLKGGTLFQVRVAPGQYLLKWQVTSISQLLSHRSFKTGALFLHSTLFEVKPST